jgi:anaerobic selenocysteine-containing dehydrogenase
MSEIRCNCSICSLACPLILRGGERSPVFTGEALLSLDWDTAEGSKYGGSLCARGAAMVEFVSHPERLNYPLVLGERTTYAAAVTETAKGLAAVRDASGGDAIGVVLGENLTNEEAALAQRFARDVLGTSNVALFAPDDIPLQRAWLEIDLSGLRPAGAKPSGEKEVYLLIGDCFTEHPCTAKVVAAGKYAKRGNEVIVVSPDRNHTAWFASRHLLCRPGGEAAVAAGLLKAVAGKSGAQLTPGLKQLVGGLEWSEIERLGGVGKDAIEGAAGAMLGAAKLETYVSNIFGRFASPGLVSLLAEAATRICPGETTYEPQFVQQNTWGIYSVIGGDGAGPLLEKIENAGLKALVVLGVDLFSAFPAAQVEKAVRESTFIVATQLFRGQTAERANVVVPAAGLVEKRGTVSPTVGEEIVREKTIDPPGGAVSDERFLIDVAAEMGVSLAAGPAQRRTARSGAGDGIAAEWTAYTAVMRGLDAAEVVMIPWSEAVHAADGTISRNLHWSKVTCAEPLLMVSPAVAEELQVGDGDRVKVTTEGGETVLAVKRTGTLEGRTVAATIHFPAVRRLFPWKRDERHGEIELAPVPVTLGRHSEKS